MKNNRNVYFVLLLVLISLTFSQVRNRQARQDQEKRQQFRKNAAGKFQETLSYLKSDLPKLYLELNKLRSKGDKKRFRRIMFRITKSFVRFKKIKGLNIEGYELAKQQFELEAKVMLIVLKYQNSTDDIERQAYKAQVSKLLEDAFEIKRKIANQTIQRFEEKIEQNKEKLAERDKNKNEIINRRLGELLDKDLDW